MHELTVAIKLEAGKQRAHDAIVAYLAESGCDFPESEIDIYLGVIPHFRISRSGVIFTGTAPKSVRKYDCVNARTVGKVYEKIQTRFSQGIERRRQITNPAPVEISDITEMLNDEIIYGLAESYQRSLEYVRPMYLLAHEINYFPVPVSVVSGGLPELGKR